MPGPLCSRRQAIRAAAPLLAALAGPRGVALAQPPTAPDAARAALAPTGRLRAALILSNPVLVRRDAATGALGGVSVELARALAERLGVAMEPVPYANPAAYAASLQGEIPWDAGFAARDPARGEFLDFSPTFMEVDMSSWCRRVRASPRRPRWTAPGCASPSRGAARRTSS